MERVLATVPCIETGSLRDDFERLVIGGMPVRCALFAAALLVAACGGSAQDAPIGEVDPAEEPGLSAPAVESTWCCASHTAQGVRIETFCGPDEEWSVNWSNRNPNVRCWEVEP